MHPILLFLLLLPLLSLAQTDSSNQPIYSITITATAKPTLVWTTPPGNAPHSEVPYHQTFTAYFNTIQTPLSGSIGLGSIKGRVGVSRSYPLNITQKPNISLGTSSTGVVRQDLNVYPDGNLKKPTWATVVASAGGTYNLGPTYSQNKMDFTSSTLSPQTSPANSATTVIGSSATEISATSSKSTSSTAVSSTSILTSSVASSTTLDTLPSTSTTVSSTGTSGDGTTNTISTSSETMHGDVGETPTTSSLTTTPGIVVTPTTSTTTSSTPAGAAINTATTTQPGINTVLPESSTSSSSVVNTLGIVATGDSSTVSSTLTTPA